MILHSDQGFWNSIYGMNQIVGRMFVDRYVSKAHKAEVRCLCTSGKGNLFSGLQTPQAQTSLYIRVY